VILTTKDHLGGIMMKKELLLAFVAIFLMSLTAITGVYAIENDIKRVTLITKSVDITGDGKVDDIKLEALPYDHKEKAYKEFILGFTLSNGQTYEEKLDYGFVPKMSVIDLSHDGIKDVFVSIPTNDDEQTGNHYLFTAKDFNLTEEQIPELPEIYGQFTNGYKARISIPATKKAYTFDLMIRKDKYESLGMYQNGKLNEPMELKISPESHFEPAKIEGEYDLKSIQRINGTSDSDSIGIVESYWKYKNHNWTLVKTKIKETEK
jgi:hypothetical protein